MSTITFKNVSSDSLNMMITKTPVVPCSVPDFETVIVPDGDAIRVDKKTRQPIPLTIETAVFEENSLRAVYALFQGTGKLILSNESDKYYNATVKSVQPESISKELNNVLITFELEPYAYAVSNEEISLTLVTGESHYKYANGVNSGTVKCEPTFKITGTGDITFWVGYDNCITITGVTDYVTVSTKKPCFIKNSSGNIITSQSTGDISKLILNPGNNQIIATPNVTAVTVIKNERWY